MSARDDYPLLASWSEKYRNMHALIYQAAEALDEIDRLRNVYELHREILDDVLPTMVVHGTSYLKVDNLWVRVTNESEIVS